MFDLSSIPQPAVRYGLGLWRRRWIVAGVAWLVALAIWFLIWLIPDKFESRAVVFVQTETILDPVLSGVTARPNYERRVEVMRRQLLTRPNIEKIIFGTGLRDLLGGGSALAREAALQSMTDWVADSIRIDSTQEMYFVISYRFGDPTIARDVVDQVVNMLIEQDIGASLTESEDARRRLRREIESYDARLTEKDREIAEFRRANAEELAVVEGRALRRNLVETEIARASEEISLAKRRLRSLRNIISTTPRTSSGSQLDALLVELAALRSQYKDTHPDIQNVQARIAELRAGSGALPLNPEYRRLENELRAAEDLLATLEEREQELLAEREKLAFTVGQAPAAHAELQRIQRDYDQIRESYEQLLARSERLNLTESLSAGGAGVEYHVYERPQTAIKPVSPPRLILIVGAFVVALGAGAAAAFGITFFERSFTQTGELEKAFGLPVLGALSEVSSDVVKARRISDLARLGVAMAALVVLCGAYVYLSVFKLPATSVSGAQSASADESAYSMGAADPEGV
ncbi:MAG: XrtA system polysaccharide chain length determinant [Pseudomonadota bacterium]